MDVVAVEEAAQPAIEAVRAGGGPHFLEFRTYRFRAHSMFDAELYRHRDEVEMWKQHDPIDSFRARLLADDALSEAEWEFMEQDVAAEVEAAVAYAEAAEWERVEDLERFVYSEVTT
jgi:TPP-dependent pyruvate/acetoin dehydrogenase alpha subunit